MQKGQMVSVVEAFAGQQLKRVVNWDERYVYVCRDQEFTQAEQENREPVTIAFPRAFVQFVSTE